MHIRWIGLFLIFSGVFIFVRQSNLVPLYSLADLSFLFFLCGCTLIAIAFLKTNGSLALAGGMIAAISIYKWGINYIQGWPADFEILVMLIGSAFLVPFAITKQRWTAVIGIVTFCCGLFAWPGIKEIPLFEPIASFLNLYWPVLIIGLGLMLFTRRSTTTYSKR
jgi:hypothetical protein